MLHETSIIL